MVSCNSYKRFIHPKGVASSSFISQAFEAARGSQFYRICCVVGHLKYPSTSACPPPCIFGKLASCIIWDECKIFYQDTLNIFRQYRIFEDNGIVLAIKVEPEGGFKEHKYSPRSPCLWLTGNRIKCWALPSSTIKAAKEFRQPPEFHKLTRTKETCKDHQDFSLESAPRKA